MSANRRKTSPHPFPRAKIYRIVESVLPKGKRFELRTTDSQILEKKVVRIVTPAWKELRPPERISKVLAALDGKLSDSEQDRILRISVLTPKEYRNIVVERGVSERRAIVRRPAVKNLIGKRRTASARAKGPKSTGR